MEPLLEVILISDKLSAVPEAKVTVREVTESLPEEVTKVNVSKSVMPDSGATVESEGSVPLPKVVSVAAGVAGDPVGTTPAE